MYTKFYHLINKIFSALNIFVSIFIKVLSSLFVKIIIVTSFFPFSRILLCLVEVSGICYLCEARSQKNAKALQTQQVDLSSQAANSVLFFFIFFSFSSFFLYLLSFYTFFFEDGVSFYSPGWPETLYGAQVGFKLEEILLSQLPCPQHSTMIYIDLTHSKRARFWQCYPKGLGGNIRKMWITAWKNVMNSV